MHRLSTSKLLDVALMVAAKAVADPKVRVPILDDLEEGKPRGSEK